MSRRNRPIRSRLSKNLPSWHRYFLKHLRWWLEKNWFEGDSYGWCVDVSVLLAQIVGTDRFKLFSGRVLGMDAPDGNNGHAYGLLDDTFIVDLTLDGFRYPSGQRGPRIVAVPEWSSFVGATYRYSESATNRLNNEVRTGKKYIECARWNSLGLQAFQGLYREWSTYLTLESKPLTAETKKQIKASQWAWRGHCSVFAGKAKRVIMAFRKARALDPRVKLPSYLPNLRNHVTQTGRRA